MATQQKSGIYGCTHRFVWLVLVLCVKFGLSLSDLSTCKKWSDIANSMSENGQFSCRNNATDICTRYDCEGSSTERLSAVVEIDYCFGIQLNSCLSPLSLDFYMKIPSHNISAQYRIKHDQIIYLSDLGIPQLNSLPIKPLLDFELEKDGTESVLVSVTFKVRSSFGSIYFDQYEQSIIQEEELPLEHCSGTPTPETSNEPAADFMSAPCHPDKYTTPTASPATPSGRSSETYNKTCDLLDHPCSLGETCQMSVGGDSSLCVCEPDYIYVFDLKACVSRGSVGYDCKLKRDCGVYEECRRDTCQCEESFSWDEMRHLCILDTNKHQPHSHSSDEDHKHHTASPIKQTTTTTTTTTEKPSNHTGADAQTQKTSTSNTQYIIIAASAVGGVVLIASVVAGLLLCRRRRRDRSAARGSGLYDSDTPMLADTDDDVDLIM